MVGGQNEVLSLVAAAHPKTWSKVAELLKVEHRLVFCVQSYSKGISLQEWFHTENKEPTSHPASWGQGSCPGSEMWSVSSVSTQHSHSAMDLRLSLSLRTQCSDDTPSFWVGTHGGLALYICPYSSSSSWKLHWSTSKEIGYLPSKCFLLRDNLTSW